MREVWLQVTVSLVLKDHCHSTMDKFAAVRRDTDGNGALVKVGPAKHVQLISTKTRNRVPAYDVHMKPPPYLSLKTAGVRVDYPGMERAV